MTVTERYGELLAQALPKVIDTDEEFDRSVESLEALATRAEDGEILDGDELELQRLLLRLIEDYDSRFRFPNASSGLDMLKYLMEKSGVSQADLIEPVFGSSGIASNVLSGKRELSKAHIRALGRFFDVDPGLFL